MCLLVNLLHWSPYFLMRFRWALIYKCHWMMATICDTWLVYQWAIVWMLCIRYYITGCSGVTRTVAIGLLCDSLTYSHCMQPVVTLLLHHFLDFLIIHKYIVKGGGPMGHLWHELEMRKIIDNLIIYVFNHMSFYLSINTRYC